ncbi:MAG: helix-turn-helix domain-containing protein [Planctomycetota bacterium]
MPPPERRNPASHPHTQLTRRAIRLILANREAGLTTMQLAVRLHVSEAHLRRVFRAATGVQLGKYATGLRLARGRHALRHTRRPITDIAYDAGYANPESFSRAHRHAYAVSPRNLRKTAKDTRRMPPDTPALALQFIKIPIRQFDEARQFYGEVLGLPEAFAVEAYGWAQFGLTPVPLCLYVVGMGGGDGEPGGDAGFHLAHPDLDALEAKLRAAGYPPAIGVTEADDGGRFLVAQDPDSNTFKVVLKDP